MTTLSKNKVVLGLSGGVDSTTAALLLKEKGLEVVGFYFDISGCNEEGRKAAADLAERLGIEFISADVSAEFTETVIENFCSEYCAGRTPNPCVLCNPTIKFKKLKDVADSVGAYYIATGHYARLYHEPAEGEEGAEKYYIRRGANEKKDQSYMLYRLGQEYLSRLILPLGEFEDKEATRSLARENQMPNAENADSQEICFIDDSKGNYVSYIEERGLSGKKGNFVDASGKVLGKHKGLLHYTIGQRKGLGITLGKPAFVTAINAKTGDVTLGDNADLFKKEVLSQGNLFTFGEGFHADGMHVLAKIRYAAKPSPAVLSVLPDGRVLTTFEEPQRAPTPGQSIVFYDGDHVIGGGYIE